MTGLESIINQIAGDAQQEASEILAGAKERAEKAAKEAQEEAKRQADAILQKGEQDAKDIRERAQSAAELEKRNQMLSFKQSLIGEAIEGTRASLEDAPAALQALRPKGPGRAAAEPEGFKAPARRFSRPFEAGCSGSRHAHFPCACRYRKRVPFGVWGHGYQLHLPGGF